MQLSLGKTFKIKGGEMVFTVFGRPEWRKSNCVRKVPTARSGESLAEPFLPLHEWSLGVTEEERLVWATKAVEVNSRPSNDVAADWLQWVPAATVHLYFSLSPYTADGIAARLTSQSGTTSTSREV